MITFLTSCDKEAQLLYLIKNNTNKQIKVIVTNTNSAYKSDTTPITKNEQKTIAIYGQGLNSVDYYKEEGQTLRYFTQMDVLIVDTIKSTTDFLETSQWEYVEKNSQYADYILTVNNDGYIL